MQELSKIPLNTVVFIDETGIDKYFQREKGRAIMGQKVEDTKRGRRFQRTNVVGGLCDGKYWAVECYNHTTNSSFFESWFEKNLLCEVPPNYTIVMDNARFHRKEKLYQLAKNVGVNLLFLPAYSPDFNPIEKSWANLKRWLKDNLSYYPFFDLAVFDFFHV